VTSQPISDSRIAINTGNGDGFVINYSQLTVAKTAVPEPPMAAAAVLAIGRGLGCRVRRARA
jgi:hypothetical protein